MLTVIACAAPMPAMVAATIQELGDVPSPASGFSYGYLNDGSFHMKLRFAKIWASNLK
jgi:hypothetical protein